MLGRIGTGITYSGHLQIVRDGLAAGKRLDQKGKTASKEFFKHPLLNTVVTALLSAGLTAFVARAGLTDRLNTLESTVQQLQESLEKG